MGGSLRAPLRLLARVVDEAVFAFLDCGIYERGFACVVWNDCRGNDCRAEFLVAFSCQRRGVCPSCAAKRGAMFGALLGELCRAGWEVVRELMIAATQRPDLQPGMVSVVHSAGDLL